MPDSLQSVDIRTSDGQYHPGLVPVYGRDLSSSPIDEHVVVMEARSLSLLDFVFFRRYSDGRSSQVAAYVVDNSDEEHTKQDLAELHRQVWLQGKAPLLYVAWPDHIDIVSCARGEDFWDKRHERCRYKPARRFPTDPLTTAGDISTALASFSLCRLDNGTFWEERSHRALVDHQKTAHNVLIQAVVETDRSFPEDRRGLLRRLLLLMVLIKYLEDRHVFPEQWFADFSAGASTFEDVLRSYDPLKVCAVLTALEVKFNGDVFVFPHDELTADDLRILADLIEGKTLEQQRHLWKLFSFEHIPVEVISHLYQRFVHDDAAQPEDATETATGPDDEASGGHGAV